MQWGSYFNHELGQYWPTDETVDHYARVWGVPGDAALDWYVRVMNSTYMACSIVWEGVLPAHMHGAAGVARLGVFIATSTPETNGMNHTANIPTNLMREQGIAHPEWLAYDINFYPASLSPFSLSPSLSFSHSLRFSLSPSLPSSLHSSLPFSPNAR